VAALLVSHFISVKRARKILTVVISVVLIAVCLFLTTAMLTDTVILPHHRAKLSSRIIAAYRDSAARGSVIAAEPGPHTVQTWSMCIYSPPLTVRVTAAGGSNYTYRAIGHPQSDLKATSWTFRLIMISDHSGKVTFPAGG